MSPDHPGRVAATVTSSESQRSGDADTLPSPVPAGRQRRRRTVRALVIAVVAVLALGAIVDVGARLIAERIAAQRFQHSQNLTARPDVSIEGWPFLTQLTRGKFADVRLHATGLVVHQASGELRIQSLDAHLHGVVPSRDLASAHADSGTGTILVSYPDLTRTTGVELSYGGNGRVRAATSVTVLGQTMSASASASIKVAGNGGLAFSDVTVDVAGIAVPQQLTALITQQLDNTVSFTDLPAGLQITTVTADQHGVHADLAVHNANLRQPR